MVARETMFENAIHFSELIMAASRGAAPTLHVLVSLLARTLGRGPRLSQPCMSRIGCLIRLTLSPHVPDPCMSRIRSP
jgi:hypothetical protein